MEFEWDDTKADSNYKKHGVRFSEAVTVWLDDAALEIPDPDHARHEERWIRIGLSRSARALVVVYVEKVEGQRVRIISARKATRSESEQYER
ncbi:MAG TPA: BrnT family toxin [Bdellovibrionales bacterium]|nr:BrnT family toxin [Bdellovibrionales bacterium]